MKTISKLEITYPKLEALEPYILIPREIYEQVIYFVDKVKDECQWFHTVKKTVQDKKIEYKIDNIFIPRQIVSGIEVESLSETFVKLLAEIKQKYNNDREVFNPILQSLTCWSHSHVNMGVAPSGTDLDTFKQMIENGIKYNNNQPQLMMIVNKRSEVFSQCYDPELGVLFKNIPIFIEEPWNVDLSYVEEALKEKLIPKDLTLVRQAFPIYQEKKLINNIESPWEKHTANLKEIEENKINRTMFDNFFKESGVALLPIEKVYLENFFNKNFTNLNDFIDPIKKIKEAPTQQNVEKLVEYFEVSLTYTQTYYLYLLLNKKLSDEALKNTLIEKTKNEPMAWFRKEEAKHLSYILDYILELVKKPNINLLEFFFHLLIAVYNLEKELDCNPIEEFSIKRVINTLRANSEYKKYK